MNPNLSLDNLMKEAEKMQQRMKAAQQQLAELFVTGKAGGGHETVELEMNGRHEVRNIKIHASLMEEGPEIVGELVAAAVNDAVRKIEKASQQKISELTSGLNIPTDFMGGSSGDGSKG